MKVWYPVGWCKARSHRSETSSDHAMQLACIDYYRVPLMSAIVPVLAVVVIMRFLQAAGQIKPCAQREGNLLPHVSFDSLSCSFECVLSYMSYPLDNASHRLDIAQSYHELIIKASILPHLR